ncbi:MAG: hypothetical protein NC123_19485 [Butyrivibrio sp.]|nr:hypothetical protein [Acetatifactor muris]MCM1561692.1 hypothetical protein [Butyrivibrio sp.]
MKKAAAAVRLVIKNILFIGFTVQICLGLIWMAANFTKVQDFTPVDTGVYPLFLRVAGRWPGLVYLLQLGAAFYAGCRLLKSLGVSQKICLWGSLALLTLPMAMQCHMALLPYSFVASLAQLELSFAWESAEEGEKSGEGALWGSLACFGAQCLLWPEYCIPGAVLPLLLLLRRLPGMLRKKERLFRGLLLVVCFAAVTAAGWAAERSEESAGGGTPGWNWLLAKRFGWPTIWADWGGAPEELGLTDSNEVWWGAYYPSYMDIYVKPGLETMTPEAGAAVMKKMVSRAWRIHYPMIVRQIGWDVLGYSVTPVILPLQLAGDAYDSCSGRNYEIMRGGTPVLAKYYVRVSCGWFTVSLVLLAGALASGCIGRFLQAKEEGKTRRVCLSRVFPYFAAAVSAGAAVLFFTIQGAGIMDYKYTVWINQLWIVWSIAAAGFDGKNQDRRNRVSAV